MKIAIQGHPTRGKEVIQILESLGGLNSLSLLGTNSDRYYFIYDTNIIMNMFYNANYKIYTLEEFEKEYPFKIGDKVTHWYASNFVGTVVDIKFDDNIPYRVDINGAICTCGKTALKPYKEMKEERNVKLTLEKAKEWYKKGGELKEIALQAFTEKELNPLPRSWEEFCKSNPIKISEAVICTESTIVTCDSSEVRDSDYDREICPSMKSAEAHLAMIQLEQLRNCWWNDWKPEWNNNVKNVIKWEGDNLIVFTAKRIHAFLVFPTKEMAEEFLECFRDLIEKAGDLI